MSKTSIALNRLGSSIPLNAPSPLNNSWAWNPQTFRQTHFCQIIGRQRHRAIALSNPICREELSPLRRLPFFLGEPSRLSTPDAQNLLPTYFLCVARACRLTNLACLGLQGRLTVAM